MPTRRVQGWRGALASLLFHALILLLIIGPAAFTTTELNLDVRGGGGAGPAGGGGGGNRGTGGEPVRERLTFMQMPQPVAPVPPVVKPLPTPVPKPTVVPPPEPVTPTPSLPVAPKIETPAIQGASTQPGSVVPGVGGGSGRDGSMGSGPGSGGGVGSGIGTGRGSANGPGTGGGDAAIYPPSPTVLVLPPQPIPAKVRPYELVAYFDVDTLGNATLISFTPSKDAGYNKRVKEMLSEIRFRPAVRVADGRPVRDTAKVTVTAH